MRKLIEDGEASAKQILTTYHDQWEAIALALLEYETLTGDELRALMDGVQPTRPDDSGPTSKASGVPSAGKAGKKRPDAPPEPGWSRSPTAEAATDWKGSPQGGPFAWRQYPLFRP